MMSPKLAWISLRNAPSIPNLTFIQKTALCPFGNMHKQTPALQNITQTRSLPCVKQPVLESLGPIDSSWLRIPLGTRFSPRQVEPHSSVHAGVSRRESSRTKNSSLTPRDQKRKRQHHEPASEEVASSLFSRCEWVRSLILRDLEASPTISCDNIYSTEKKERCHWN